MTKFRITVPATSANLGPGFDCMGVALSLYDHFEVELAQESGRASIQGCAPEWAGDDNLLLRAYREGWARLLQEHQEEAGSVPGRGSTQDASPAAHTKHILRNPLHARAGTPEAPPLAVRFHTEIPPARGLGSSAALLTAGAAAALILYRILRGQSSAMQPGSATLSETDRAWILQIAAAMEGHPDNVAPAVYGGFCAAMPLGDGGFMHLRFPVASSWHFLAAIPDFPLETAKARKALPDAYHRSDTVHAIAHSALTALSWASGNPDTLAKACQDRIHQPYRMPLIAGGDSIATHLQAHGAAAVWISGSGPTLLSLHTGSVPDPDELRGDLDAAMAAHWSFVRLEPDHQGIRVDEIR